MFEQSQEAKTGHHLCSSDIPAWVMSDRWPGVNVITRGGWRALRKRTLGFGADKRNAACKSATAPLSFGTTHRASSAVICSGSREESHQ